jgi:hypothetical protein
MRPQMLLRFEEKTQQWVNDESEEAEMLGIRI